MTERFTPEFVEFMPPKLEEGKLYISMEYGTVVHLCASGCGEKVVTPLSPTDWRLIYNGETVSLDPSIGNWNFECRSHYWIRNGKVRWSASWTDDEIREGRERDRRLKTAYYDSRSDDDPEVLDDPTASNWLTRALRSAVSKIRKNGGA